MSARFEVGELVDITIKGARVEAVEAFTNSLTVFYRPGLSDTTFDSATLMLGGAVDVTRVAPREWPPQPGDVWESADGRQWFAGELEDSDGTWLHAAGRSVGCFDHDALAEHGPMRLAYRRGWTPAPAPAVEPTGKPSEPVDKRTALIQGLRKLADFLDANPDVPLPQYGVTMGGSLSDGGAESSIARVRSCAAFGFEQLDDGRPVGKVWHFSARRRFGPIDLQLSYVSDVDPASFTPVGGEVAGSDSPQAGPATATDETVEHHHAGGAFGGPGEHSAVCSCGYEVDGFDSQAEAVEYLALHIADAAKLPRLVEPAPIADRALADAPAGMKRSTCRHCGEPIWHGLIWVHTANEDGECASGGTYAAPITDPALEG